MLSLPPGTDPRMAAMISQAAIKDPEGLAKLFAAQGIPVPAAPGIGTMTAGQMAAPSPASGQSLGAMMDPGPAPAFTPQPELAPGMQTTGITDPTTPAMLNSASAAADKSQIAGKSAALAMALSQLHAPPPPQVQQPMSAPAIGGSPINAQVNPQHLQNLMQMLLQRQGPQKTLGSIMPQA